MKRTLCLLMSGMLAAALPAATNYVDCSFTSYEGHDGSSWEKAFKTIQEGVAAASSGDVVLVAPAIMTMAARPIPYPTEGSSTEC